MSWAHPTTGPPCSTGVSAGPRPRDLCPWLDSIPSRLAEHPTWGPYLRDRADRITGLAASVRAEAEAWAPADAPAWASGLTAGEDAVLRGDLSVWRAAFAVPEDDGRPTGPVQSGSSTTPHQRDLDRRAKAVLGVHRADENLTELLPDEVRSDAEFARLSERLGALQAAGIDVGSLVDRAAERRPPAPRRTRRGRALVADRPAPRSRRPPCVGKPVPHAPPGLVDVPA